MNEKIKIQFTEIKENYKSFANYTNRCSGGVSDCCTRVCTRECHQSDDDSNLQSWEDYLEDISGIVQY